MRPLPHVRSARTSSASMVHGLQWRSPCSRFPIFSAQADAHYVSLIGISIIFSLSYNILLGQTVYCRSVMQCITASADFGNSRHEPDRQLETPGPLPLVPFIGGIAGLFFAAILGWVPTRRSRTAFAMISLGVAELVASSSLILRSFSAAKPASPLTAPSSCGCSTGISGRRFRSIIWLHSGRCSL